MKPLAMRAYLLVILAIVAGVQSGPISNNDNTCATRVCDPAGNKFGYAAGSSYSYLYEADTVTSLQGAAEEHSSLHIRAIADVTVLSPCELALTLRDVTLEQSDPSDLNRRSLSENSRQFKRSVEARPIRFSFHDGHVDSVCADSSDASWVVNLKRGIISGLQNTMKNLDQNHEGTETDVAGVCTAKYSVGKRGWGGATTVSKQKDLTACSDRHGHFSSMQATPYKLSSDVHSMPLLRGSHQCDQTISKEGVMQRSEIRESHTFRPFSSQDSGATTTTRQLLTFQAQAAAQSINMGSMERSSLLFDHSDAEEARQEQGAEQVEAILLEICALSEVRPETPRLYSRLVYALRKMDARAMSAMHRRVEAGAICSQNNAMAIEFFHDAIPSVSTAASASLMRELIESGEMSQTDADIWLTSLAFTAQPSSEMIREISPLLKREQPSKKMFLAISTLVHGYCRQNEDCQYNNDVQEVLKSITNNLGYNCRESDNDKMIMSLKALGNTGLHVEAIPILSRCLANTEISMDVRVAAVDAYRRMPCENRDDLMKMLMNSEEDSELRIKSYLAAMQCPSAQTLAQVREMLGQEEVNQVGSFVWTHLTNLKETADIFKQEVQDILGDEKLQKEFNLDARKFSRNYEAAMFFESLNAGAKVESNLIWSPKSFVPRSAMVNLTVDMFGQSVNFMEVGGRVEGAEDYMQKLFGPDGYFPAESRQKRSVDTDKLLTDLNRADPKAAAYLKIFGNELHTWDLRDFNNVEKDDMNIVDLLIKLAQEHEVEWSRSAMFLDSEIAVPTALGLPLKLSVNGSATVDIKVGGKFDIRQLAVYPNSMDINGYVKPSGAIEISSVMGLDAFFAQTGLKMVSTMHTSTEVDGLIKLDESSAITAKFNMPKDKIEILSVKTQFFIVHKGEDREQAMLTDNRVTMSKCSCDKTSQALGVRVCGEVSYPATSKADAPYFPFTGPISASVELLKTDDHKAYELEAYLKTEKAKGSINRFARFSFNTPGSKVDREILADVAIDSANQKVTANLKTPWKEATIDGSLVNKDELKSLRFDMTVDKKPTMSLLSELQIDARPKATKLNPNVELRFRNKPVMTLRGDAKYVIGNSIDTDLTLDSTLLSSPIVLKGGVESAGNNVKTRYNTDITLKSSFINTKISGFTQTKDGLVSSRTEFNYDWNDGSKHEFVVNGKMKDMSKGKLTKYMTNTAITSTEYPEYNLEMDVNMIQNPKHLETSLDLHYGADSKDMKKRILITQELDVTGNAKNLNVDHVAKLKWKAMDIDMQSKLSHSHDLYQSIKTNGKFSYRPNKEISLNVDMMKEDGPLTKMSGDIMFEYPGREMRFTKNIAQKSADEFSHEMLLQWQKGGQVRSSTVYTRMPAEKRHEITSELYGPVGKPTVVTGAATLKMDDFSGKVQVAHKGEIYQAETSYDYDIKQAQTSMNGKLDVIIPSRRITADTTVSSGKGEHSINIKSAWDADKDASKKFSLNGVLSTQTGNHVGDLKVTIPARTVSVSFNNKFDGEKFNSRADVTWAPQKSISMISSGAFEITSYSQKLQGSLEVNTPFVQQVLLNVNHRFNKRRLDNQVDVSYGGEKMVSSDLSVQMLNGFESMDNRFALTTPAPAFRTFVIAQSHSLTGNALTGHVEGSLNGMEIAADISGEMAGNNLKASAALQTPFSAIRKASTSWEHNMNGPTVTAHVEGSLNRQSIIVDMSNTFTGSALNNKLSLQSTFNPLRTAEIETVYSYNPRRSVNGNFAMSRNGGQVIALSGEMNFERDIEGKMAVQSQFNNMEEVSAMFFVKKSHQTPKVAHAEVKWSENRVVAVDGEFSGNANSQKMELRFTSPFPVVERLILTHDQTMANGQWNSNTGFEYAPRRAVQLMTTYSNNGALDASFKLDSPCPYMKSLAASINHAGYSANFNNRATMNFQNNYYNMGVDHSLTMRGAGYVKGNTLVKSNMFGAVQVAVDHQEVEGEQITKVDINMPSKDTVTVETHFENRREMKASAQITTTYSQMPSFFARVNHQGQGAYFSNEVVVQSQIMRQPVNLESSIRINGAASQDISIKMNSPFAPMEDVAFTISHSFDGENLNCHSEVKLDSRRSIVADNKVSFGRTFSVHTDIKTPFRAFRSFSVDLDHTGPVNRFNNKANLKMVTTEGATVFDSAMRVAGFRLINGQLSFSSPSSQAEMNLKHGLRGAAWMTDFDMTLPNADKIEFTSNINTEDVSANMELKTPYVDPISLTANSAIEGGVMVATGSFTYAARKTIQSTVRYGNGDTFILSADLTSPCPYLGSVQASVEHTGPWNNFDNKMIVGLDNKRYTSEATFQFDFRNLNAKLSLDAPTIMNHMEAAVTHTQKSSGRYECSASARSGDDEMTATANINVPSVKDISIDISASTPFRVARRLALNLKHNGELSNFQNSVEFQRNNEKSTYTGSFSNDGTISGDFMLKTPYQSAENMQVTFSSNGLRRNNIEVTYATGKKVEATSIINMNNGFKGELKFNAPFSAPLSIEVNCAGMTHSTEVTYGNKRTALTTVMTLTPLSAKVTFTSPFEAVRDAEWVFNGDGADIGNFNFETSFEHNSRKAFDFSAEYSSRQAIQGKAQWTSIFRNFEDISVEFKHAGSIENFETTGHVSYAPNKKIAVSMQLKTVPSIEAHFNLDTPCTYVENLNINLAHNGGKKNFKTTGDVSYNGKKQGDLVLSFSSDKFVVDGAIRLNSVIVDLDTDFQFKSNRKEVATEVKVIVNGQAVSGQASMSFKPSVAISIALQSPYKYAKDVSMNLEAADDSNTMSHTLVLKSDMFGRVKTTGSLQRQPLELNAQVQTPSNYLRDASVNLKHSGDLAQFTNELTLTHNKYGQVAYSGSFSANPMTGKFELKTPYSKVQEVLVTFDHASQARGFRTNSVVSVNGQEYKLAADVKAFPESTLTIETPHQAMKKMYINVRSNNNLRAFEGSMNMMKNDEQFISSEVAWQTEGKLESNFKLNTIFDVLRSIEGTVRHRGGMRKFNNFLELSYNNKQVAHGESTFTLTPLTGSFLIEVPAAPLRSLKGEFSHDGSAEQFRTHGELTYNTHNQFMADVAFQRYPTIEATFQLSTPFQQLESASLKINHQGSLRAFQSNAEVTINKRDNYGAQAQFSMEPEVEGKLSIASPIRGYRNMNGGFRFSGDYQKFNGRANMAADDNILAIDGSFQVRPLNAKVTVQTPFTNYQDLSAEMTHTGNMRNGFTSQAAVAYQTGKKIEANADINIARRKMDLSLKTPFRGYEEMTVSGKHSMDNNGLNTKLDASLGSDKATAEMTLQMSPFEARLDINTPVKGLRRIAVTGNHQMSRNGINSNAQIAYAGKSIEVSVSGQYNSINDMNGAIAIQTPFRTFSNMKLAGSHNTRPAIKTTFEASLNDKKVEAEFEMANSNNVDASVTVHTPFSGYEEITTTLNHAGNLRKFTTKVTAGQRFVLLTTFDSTSNIEGLFKLTCPCPYLNNIGAEFNFIGQKANFETSGKLYKDDKEITADARYTSENGIPTMVTAEISTPFTETIMVEANNNYRGGNFQTSGSLAWSPRQKITAQADGTLRGSLSNLQLSGNVEINTPFRGFNQMKVSTQHQHSMEAISNKLDVDFNRQKVLDTEVQYNKASGKVEMQVPYSVAASVDSTGNLDNMNSNVELKWNKASTIKFEVSHKDESSSSGINREMSVRAITAYRTMAFATKLVKNAYTLSHTASLSWDEARDKTVSYKVDFNDRSRRYKHLYTLVSSVDTPIRSAEFVMNHNDDSATYNTEATLKWDSKRDATRMLSVSNKYTVSGNSHDDELTITHPAMTKALVLRNKYQLNQGNVLFGGRTEIDFLASPMMVDVLVENKASESGSINYSLTMGVSHPSSSVDIKTVAHVANSPSMMSSGLQMNYLTARRQQVNLGLMAQINKIKKSLNIQVDTPIKKVELSGDVTPLNGGVAVNMAAESEGQSINGRLETSNNEFDMKIFYSPESPSNVMHVSGKYVSATDLMLEAYRMHDGQKISESTVSIDLENGHLFKTSIYWRPSMIADLKNKAQTVSRQVSRQVSDLYAQSSDAISMEARYKQRSIRQAAPDMSGLSAALDQEIRSFQLDAQVIAREYNQMYYRNEFYMKNIGEAMENVAAAAMKASVSAARAINQAGVAMAEKWEQFVYQARLQTFHMAAYANQYVESAMEATFQGMNAAKAQLYTTMAGSADLAGELIANATRKLQAYTESVVQRTLYVAERVLVAIRPLMEAAVDLYERVSACIAKISDTVVEVAHKKLPMVYLNKQWSQLMDKVYGIDILTPVSDVQVSIRDNVRDGVSRLNDVVTKMARKSTREMSARMQILNARFSDFLEHDDTKYAHQLVQEAYTQAKQAFEYMEVEQKVTELIKATAETIVRVVRKNAFYMIDDYLNLDQDKIAVYNPREGQIEFQMWIPMRLPTLQAVRMPDVEVLSEVYAKSKEIATGLIPQDFSPYDFYYQYKPKTASIVPPFEAYAMISGAQHYMTFDKRFFEFAGSCSYTLAREFVDQTFEVLVNYEDDREVQRKSITVRTEGKSVDILSKGMVSVDGVQTELPVEFGSVQITRQGHMIQLVSGNGFEVSCDIANDMCMLTISGWHYNKVAGLFGTYTNEKSDDFLTSEARQVSDLKEFTHSWVSGRCRNIENRARSWESQSKHACQKLFNNNESSFRRCYKIVDPTPFVQMCANDVLEDVSNQGEESSSCKSAAMYVMACKQEGVPLRLPRSCVACGKPSYDTYNEGEELTAYAADQSADVIFVVDEKPCNTDAMAKLGEIAQQIDASLKVKALKNNQFGLIGFGGYGIHDDEHTHTVAGKILGSSQDFSKAVESLDITKVGNNTDIFKALRMAAKYPFRAGVAKSIVLVTCSECTEQAARYNEIAFNLRTRGISLHIIMNHEFLLGPHDMETPKTNYLFGIDKDTAFTSRHVSDQELNGDADLFRMIQTPDSMCARLAQSTDGSFFSMDKLTAGRVRFQKHFVDVFSRRVAKSAVVPDCQVCECESDSNGAARSVCKPCTGAVIPKPLDSLPAVPEQFYQVPQHSMDYEE